jgi:hypothetical protein
MASRSSTRPACSSVFYLDRLSFSDSHEKYMICAWLNRLLFIRSIDGLRSDKSLYRSDWAMVDQWTQLENPYVPTKPWLERFVIWLRDVFAFCLPPALSDKVVSRPGSRRDSITQGSVWNTFAANLGNTFRNRGSIIVVRKQGGGQQQRDLTKPHGKYRRFAIQSLVCNLPKNNLVCSILIL